MGLVAHMDLRDKGENVFRKGCVCEVMLYMTSAKCAKETGPISA